MGGDEEDVSPELDVVLSAPWQTGPCQWHLLDEDREAVAGGGKVELEMTFEWLSWHQETGVKTEDGDHLLLHIDSRLAPVGGTNLVKSETIMLLCIYM